MNHLFDTFKELKDKGHKSYFFGSYVYNHLILKNNQYNDVDIMTDNVEEFINLLSIKYNKCVITKSVKNEYNLTVFSVLTCEGLEKELNILNYATNINLINKKKDLVYDFQRILYDGTHFISPDSNINLDETIEDLKKNQICYEPKNLKDKYKDTYHFNKINILKCIKRSIINNYLSKLKFANQ